MPDFLHPVIDLVDEMPPLAILGVFALFVVVIIGLGRLLRKPPSRLIAFSDSNGSVSVSRKALQELIKQACLKDPNVQAARPTVRISGDKIHTNVEMRLQSATKLNDISDRLQARITELLQKSLNFDQIGKIEIMVTSFGKNDVDEASEGQEIASSLSPTPKPPTPKPDDAPPS